MRDLLYYRQGRGLTYFRRSLGFSINEGAGPVNITVLWGKDHGFFFYTYLFGLRFHMNPKHWAISKLNALGRRLMALNYGGGCDPQSAVEHDLRLEIQSLRHQVSQLEIALAVERTRAAFAAR